MKKKTRYGENEMQLQNWNGSKVNINGGHSLPNDPPYSYSWAQNREQQLREKEIRT